MIGRGMPVAEAMRRGHLVGRENTSWGMAAVLAPPEWDPFFHGSVHTATLAVCTVLVIFVVILGTFGNGLVLLSAVQCRKLRSNFDVLVFNLAGADFVICSCLSPTFLYLLFSNSPSPRAFCGGFLFTSTTCGLLSLLTLVAIAAHRESRVRGRTKGALSAMKTAAILTVIYFVSLGIAVGGALHVTLSWSDSYTTCQAVMNSQDITSNNVILFFISPVIVISFIIIVVSYAIIARAVKVQTYMRVKALQSLLRPAAYKPIPFGALNEKPPGASPEQMKIRMENSADRKGSKIESLKQCSCCTCMSALEKENKAVTMCLVVILVVALCWTPLVISHIIEVITGESIILYQVKLCGIALVFLNSALDPYMYAQNSGRIKQRYGRFLWDILHCECRIPPFRKFRTLTLKREKLRTLRKPFVNPDCATLQFLHPEHRKTAVFKKCRSESRLKVSGKDQIGNDGQRTFTANILLYGEATLAPSLASKKQEVRHDRRAHVQSGVISDVRLLVHKTCCHVNSPDDQSLIES